jgi:hypothetical protein
LGMLASMTRVFGERTVAGARFFPDEPPQSL